MGKTHNCSCLHRWRHLIIPMFLLLGSKLLLSEGRVLSGAVIGAQAAGGLQTARMTAVKRRLIGSSPPRCERRCGTCRRCEAVQVPIVPQQQRVRWVSRVFANVTPRIAISRVGDDVSNYKPMTWKCKCGDLLFNP